MPLFQKSVLAKYLKAQDKNAVAAAWAEFKSYFLNTAIQQNIRNLKEEEFQEGFVRELFVKVLGYTLNPQPDYNFVLEKKNIKDSKKADGAMLFNDKVKAVIELKGTDTIDLGKIEAQAFGYKNNQTDCTYVITSNFEKLRFYIDNAVEHLEFNLFALTEEEFGLLYLCLAHANLSVGLAKKVKDESVSQEDVITKKLYKDYSLFKREMYQNLVALNPQYDPLVLFKKSQKLLDRFLFIFFAEDRNLLPTNLIFRINKEWRQLREMRMEVSLYDRYKTYFHDLNTGAKVTLPAFSQTASQEKEVHQIFAYNGGLFKEDGVLDNIRIDDELLYRHSEKLSAYDFQSEIDVNILGHIFENSLNELDEIKAQLEGQAIDKAKTKRKKDGVFYTPKYITKYIVDNTIGKLCSEKKKALEITDENYQPSTKRSRKRLDTLQQYRQWLLQLTICDPACGSGAFLNQALEFLIDEHAYVDELWATYNKDAIMLSDVEGSILENNLFGVDLNEESVEIARLSLWLRTARPNRKLNDLSDNIKCGNSLIDDPEVAGDKAFRWEQEFPQVFAKGGFDAVIGNPPYVRSRELFSKEEKSFFVTRYKTTSYQLDLYKLFIERSTLLIRPNGYLCFITPSVFLNNDFDKPLRKYLLDNFTIRVIANTDTAIFTDATVKTAIFVLQNTPETSSSINFLKIFNSSFKYEKSIKQNEFKKENYVINERINAGSLGIIKKFFRCYKLGKYYEVKNGIKIRKELIHSVNKGKSFRPFLLGRDIGRFKYSFSEKYIDYSIENEKLYTNQAFRNKEIFEQEKLIVRQILGNRIITAYDNENFFTDQTTYLINKKDRKADLYFLSCLLNSKLMHFYFVNTSSDNKITFPKIKKSQILELPIILKNQDKFIKSAQSVIVGIEDLMQIVSKFHRTLQRKFNVEDLPKRLQDWYLLSYGEFIKELAKKKITLTLAQEAEWEEYFDQEKAKALELKAKIDATDKEIDQMVYALYGLTPEEIEIVENS